MFDSIDQMVTLATRTGQPRSEIVIEAEMDHSGKSRDYLFARMGKRLAHIVEEAPQLATSWERKLDLLNEMSDILDAAMVEDGLIAPHPKYRVSPTSGYRLLESAYAELIKKCPADIEGMIPQWEQVHWESFHSSFVNGVNMEDWRRALVLEESK